MTQIEPRLVPVKEGWAAVGNGWAVFARSRDSAVAAFEMATRKHEELADRSAPVADVSSRRPRDRV